jgi:hypothetical protein
MVNQIIGDWELTTISYVITGNDQTYLDSEEFENISFNIKRNGKIAIGKGLELHKEGSYDYEIKYEFFFNPETFTEPKMNIIEFDNKRYMIQIGYDIKSRSLYLSDFNTPQKTIQLDEK